MTSNKDLAYTSAYAELRIGEEAKRGGNIGKARVCARRGCALAIDLWLNDKSEKVWGQSAISKLRNLQEDQSIPISIRDAAKRLNTKVDMQFDKGYEEDPIDDAKLIIEYFLTSK
jgi:hypothetical protein